MRIKEWPNKEKRKMNDTMRRRFIVLALAFSPALVFAQQPLSPPLKNWPAPLYWAPTPAEFEQQRLEHRIAHPDVSSSAQAASIFTPPGPMTFIAMTPCRVMDTRSTQGFTGAFGPPSLPAYGTARQVPMPSSSCSIPSNAGAYSLNITVVPPGPLSFLSVWPAGAPYPGVSTLNDPVAGGVIANAAIVVAGTSGAIQIVAGNPTDVIIDINGYYAAPTDLNNNTAVGAGALASNPTGVANTATGVSALAFNTTGEENTASGAAALAANTTGSFNTASGFQALANNTTGADNTASGYQALQNNAGTANTATGFQALQTNTTGGKNTASGSQALQNNTADGNTATGSLAMQSNTTGNSNAAFGYQALQSNTTGNYNTANGYQALANNTTVGYLTATGYQALQSNTTGGNNTAVGASTLTSNTSGSANTGVGQGTLYSNTTGGRTPPSAPPCWCLTLPGSSIRLADFKRWWLTPLGASTRPTALEPWRITLPGATI